MTAGGIRKHDPGDLTGKHRSLRKNRSVYGGKLINSKRCSKGGHTI